MPVDTLGSSLGEGEESVCFWVGFAWLGMYINYMLLHEYLCVPYVRISYILKFCQGFITSLRLFFLVLKFCQGFITSLRLFFLV